MNMKLLLTILASFAVAFVGVIVAIHGDSTLGILLASSGVLTLLTVMEG